MNDWHLVHLGSFATGTPKLIIQIHFITELLSGGAALIFTEATAVTPEGRVIHIYCLLCINYHEGRISMYDVGLWKVKTCFCLKLNTF
jgi:hypothetical protein